MNRVLTVLGRDHLIFKVPKADTDNGVDNVTPLYLFLKWNFSMANCMGYEWVDGNG